MPKNIPWKIKLLDGTKSHLYSKKIIKTFFQEKLFKG